MSTPCTVHVASLVVTWRRTHLISNLSPTGFQWSEISVSGSRLASSCSLGFIYQQPNLLKYEPQSVHHRHQPKEILRSEKIVSWSDKTYSAVLLRRVWWRSWWWRAQRRSRRVDWGTPAPETHIRAQNITRHIRTVRLYIIRLYRLTLTLADWL